MRGPSGKTIPQPDIAEVVCTEFWVYAITPRRSGTYLESDLMNIFTVQKSFSREVQHH